MLGLGLTLSLGSSGAPGATVFSMTPATMNDATFTRASTANQTTETVEPFTSYAAGGSLASATMTRASTAYQIIEA